MSINNQNWPYLCGCTVYTHQKQKPSSNWNTYCIHLAGCQLQDLVFWPNIISYARYWSCSDRNLNTGKKLLVCTVGAQSIARLCQNLVNCRRNIWAHRRRRKLRFFLFERSWAGKWANILTKVNSSNIFVLNLFELAYKKTVHFECKYGYKKFGKYKFEKENWRDTSLGHDKLILRSKTFLATWFDLYTLIPDFTYCTYSGRTKYSPCVSKLRKLSEEYLSPQKTQKAAVFFILKNLGWKMIKNLTNLKILKMFVHIASL